MKHLFQTLFCVLLSLGMAWGKDHPYDTAFVAQVAEQFMENGQVSLAKVQAHETRINRKITELGGLIRNEERAGGERDEAKIQEEIEGHKFIVALRLALGDLHEMRESTHLPTILRLAYDMLDLENATRSEGDINPLLHPLRQFSHYVRDWVLPRTSPADKEASNLWDPRTDRFLSPADMAGAGDLSLINPGSPSSFWQKQNRISNVNVERAALGKNLEVFRGIDAGFPEDRTYYFEEVKHSDTKPKIDAYARDEDGKKVKFKLKFGAELHADPTLGVIMRTLGYPTDITQYQRDIKLVIPRGTTFSDVKRQWELYYRRDNPRQLYWIENYVKEQGVDSEGREWVIFKDGLVEAKPKKIERLGPWAFAATGHQSLRELRGLTLVQLWLDNTDIKEFDNNRLLLRERGSNIERYHIISDLGHSLGGTFYEMPELYRPEMIRSQNADRLVFHYRSFHPNEIKNHMTMADARWAARQIAALTRQQLRRAVELGGWPSCVVGVYVEKMILRRNDLVRSLGIVGTPDADGNSIQVLPARSGSAIEFDSQCNNNEIRTTHTTNFDNSLSFMLNPASRSASQAISDLIRDGISGPKQINLNGYDFDMGPGVFTQLQLNFHRRIERNTRPTSEGDLFIVSDHFEVGMRLGATYGALAETIYTRAFTLTYPARSVDESRFNNGFILNALLPLHLSRGRMPEKFVLATTHHLEAGLGFELDQNTHFISPGVHIGRSRVLLMRSFLDHKDPESYVLYRDRAHFNQTALRGFVRVGILKLPFLEALNSWGHANGVGSVMPARFLDDENVSRQVNQAMVTGDFSGLSGYEAQFRLRNDFRSTQSNWNLLLWQGGQESRLDRIRLDRSSGSSQATVQYSTERTSGWRFLGFNERREVRVEGFYSPTRTGNPIELRVKVEGFDSETTDNEMGNYFVNFVNGLTITGQPLIPLTTDLGYTTNQRWGQTLTQSETTYYSEGLTRLMNSDPEVIWNALAAALKTSRSQVNILRTRYREARVARRGSQYGVGVALRQVGITQAQFNLINHTQTFIDELARARRAAGTSKLSILANAFKRIVYTQPNGFFMPTILGAVNRIVGEGQLYSFNTISAPLFAEQNFLLEAPLVAELGQEGGRDFRYRMYEPITPMDQYYMFDNW